MKDMDEAFREKLFQIYKDRLEVTLQSYVGKDNTPEIRDELKGALEEALNEILIEELEKILLAKPSKNIQTIRIMNEEDILKEKLNSALNIAYEFAGILEPFTAKDEIIAIRFNELFDQLKALDPLILDTSS